MGKRFLAILAAVSAVAGGAFVGLTTATGDWEVLGTGLAPGDAYAIKVDQGGDRLKLELANVLSDPLASFSVFGPGGARAGYFQLNGATRTAEVVVNEGIWFVFVYEAQGGDLTIAVHGKDDPGAMAGAEMQVKDVLLGQVDSTKSVDQTYTAVLDKEPVLAGVYIQGSARNLRTELKTEKGVVETTTFDQVSGVQGGMVVNAKGERSTNPANLQTGGFTAHVVAASLSGKVQLKALYLTAPDAAAFEPTPEPTPPAPPGAEKHRKSHAESHARTAAPAPPHAGPAFVECGSAEAMVPYALEVTGHTMLRLQTGKDSTAFIRVFSPMDELLPTVTLQAEPEEEEEDDEGTGAFGDSFGDTSTGGGEKHKETTDEEAALEMVFALDEPGLWVLYVNGAAVDVARTGLEECTLEALEVVEVPVASVSADLLVGPVDTEQPFALEVAPLEFGMRLSDMVSSAFNAYAVFTGSEGEAGMASIDFGAGAFNGGFSGSDRSDVRAYIDPTKMPAGDWTVAVHTDMMSGSLDLYALQYLRPDATAEEDAEDEDAGTGANGPQGAGIADVASAVDLSARVTGKVRGFL